MANLVARANTQAVTPDSVMSAKTSVGAFMQHQIQLQALQQQVCSYLGFLIEIEIKVYIPTMLINSILSSMGIEPTVSEILNKKDEHEILTSRY